MYRSMVYWGFHVMRPYQCTLVLLFILGALLLLCSSCLGDVESNDDIASAETVSSGAYTGSVDPDGGDYDDFYVLSADPGSLIELEFNNLAAAGRMNVFLMYEDPNEEGSYLVAFELTLGFGEDTGLYGTDSRTDITIFYIQVHSDAYEPGDYTFTLKLWSQTDGDIWGDAPGDRIEARSIPTGGTFVGYLGNDDEYDYYKFEASPGSRIELSFSSFCEEMVRGDGQSLTLTNRTNEQLLHLASMDGTEREAIFYLPNEPGGDEDWYVVIWSGSENELLPSADGDYEFVLKVFDQNDAGTYSDAGNWFGNAHSLHGSANITGHLEAWDYADVYKIRAGPGDIIEVAFMALGDGEMEAHLEDNLEQIITLGKFFSITSASGYQARAVHVSPGPAETWYYLIVWIGKPGWSFSGAPGDYQLDIRFLHQNDGGLGIDAPSAASFAPTVGSGIYNGTIGDDDDTDCYVVNIPPGGRLKVTLKDVDLSQGDLKVKVYGDVGSVNAIGRIDEDPQGGVVYEVWDTDEAATWYVKVTGDSTGFVFDYQMGIVIDAEPPVVDFEKPEPFPLGGPFTISLKATDDQGIAEVRLHYRIGDDREWNHSRMALRGGVYEANFGEAAIGDAEKVTYYIEVVDLADRIVELGSSKAPYTVNEVFSLLGFSGTGLVMLLLVIVVVAFVTVGVVAYRIKGARGGPSKKVSKGKPLGEREAEALKRPPTKVNYEVPPPKDLTVRPSPQGNTLRWTPPPVPRGVRIVGYRVLRGVSPDRIEPIRGLEPDLTEHVDTGITEGTTYYYKLATVTVDGDSPPTKVVRAGLAGLPGHPIYPSGYVSDNGIVIEWRPPMDTGGQPIKGFAIGRGEDTAHMAMLADVGGDQQFYEDTSVERGKSYSYSIRAVTQAGMGEQSKFVTVRFE